MRRVWPFLLLLIFPNTFSLQHPAWPWTRAPYPQPLHIAGDLARPSWTRASKRIANEKEKLAQPSKDEIYAKIIENMMRLVGMKFKIGKRSTGGKEQPKYDEISKKIKVLTKLINQRLKASSFFRYGNLKLKYQKLYLDD